MRRLLHIAILLSILTLKGFSQQTPLYSQYMMNGFLLNPAIAGSAGYSAINLTTREQWVGFQDAPATRALSFQTRLTRKSHISRRAPLRLKGKLGELNGTVGLGGYVFNHRNGAVSKTGMKITYAYHLDLDQAQLSFGLSMVGYQYRLDDDRIELEIPDDPVWSGLHKSVLIPDADAGIYLSTPNAWAGFSVDQLFESVWKFGDAGYDQLVMERTYSLLGGYEFEVSPDVIVAPSVYVKLAENGKAQVDVHGKLYYQQTYWGGITYRTGHALILMAGVSVDRLVFGYAFDIGLNSIMKHSLGTHEFTFIAKLGDFSRSQKWLTRY